MSLCMHWRARGCIMIHELVHALVNLNYCMQRCKRSKEKQHLKSSCATSTISFLHWFARRIRCCCRPSRQHIPLFSRCRRWIWSNPRHSNARALVIVIFLVAASIHNPTGRRRRRLCAGHGVCRWNADHVPGACACCSGFAAPNLLLTHLF